MNRATPVPLFNYKKRQRQALVSDPGQVLSSSNQGPFNSSGNSTEYHSAGIHDTPNKEGADNSGINDATRITTSFTSRNTMSGQNRTSSQALHNQNPSNVNKGSNAKSAPGLMDMSGNFNRGGKFTEGKSHTSFRHSGSGQCTRGNTSFTKQDSSCLNADQNNWTQNTGKMKQGRLSNQISNHSAGGGRGAVDNKGNMEINQNYPRNLKHGLSFTPNRSNTQLPSRSADASERQNLTVPSESNYSHGNLYDTDMYGHGSSSGFGTYMRGGKTLVAKHGKSSVSSRSQASSFNFEDSSIFDNDVQDQATSSFKPKTTKSNKPSPDTSLRVFTCSLSALKSWIASKESTGAVMFEIYGLLDSATVKNPSGTGKEFILRDDTGSIKCVFYEIDRGLPRLTRGQVHRVVGWVDKRREMLKVVTVRPAAREERGVCQAATSLTQAEMVKLASTSSEQ